MADKDASPDAQTDLKKRARRRLVGAVALTLLAVLVLPILMDRDARPTGQDIQIHIPAMDAKGPLPVASEVPATTALAEMTAASAQAVVESAEAPVASASSPNSPPAQIDSTATAQVSKPITSATPDERGNAPKPADSAGLSGVNSSSTQWIVRLGVYQSSANVKRLVAKLKEINVPSFTEKAELPQGSRTRVGAGPFASREAAEKAQAKIYRLGVEGSVAEKQ